MADTLPPNSQPVPLGYVDAQPGNIQPPPVYAPHQPFPPQQAGHVVVITQPGAGRTTAPGTCRHCGVGVPHASYPVFAIFIAIVFFPIGILCCLMMQETRCSHCSASL